MSAPSNNETWHRTPADILKEIKTAERAVKRLQSLAKSEGIERKFTLDGRLVGDIGELVVARFFEIVEDKKPKGHAHDVFALIKGVERGVQVKLRRESKSGDLIFKYRPEVLISLKFKGDWSAFQIVYHGSGDVIVKGGASMDEKRRLKKNGRAVEIRMSPAEFAVAAKSERNPELQMAKRNKS